MRSLAYSRGGEKMGEDEKELKYALTSLGLLLFPFILALYLYHYVSPVLGIAVFINYEIYEMWTAISHTVLVKYWEKKQRKYYKSCELMLQEDKQQRVHLQEEPTSRGLEQYFNSLDGKKEELNKKMLPFMKASEKVAYHKGMEKRREELMENCEHDYDYYKKGAVIIIVTILVSYGTLNYLETMGL